MAKFRKRRSLSNKQLDSILNQMRSQLEQLQNYCETIQAQQLQILELLQDNHPQTDVKIVNNTTTSLPENQLIDYSNLASLLERKEWQQADQETAKIMLTLAQKLDKGYLNESDLQNLPCQELEIIDQLWLDASDNKYGLSVQKQIYQSLGGTKFIDPKIWQEFSSKVGWYVNQNWLKYEQLNFSDQAPNGHLPVMGDSQVWFVGGWQGSYRSFTVLLSKLSYCKL